MGNITQGSVSYEILQCFDPLIAATQESEPQPDAVNEILQHFDPLMAIQEPEQMPNQVEEVGQEGHVILDHSAKCT